MVRGIALHTIIIFKGDSKHRFLSVSHIIVTRQFENLILL